VHRHGSVLNCLIVCTADLKTAYRHKILAQFADLEARVQSERARADALEDDIRPLVDELVLLMDLCLVSLEIPDILNIPA
jgi:hypothetical protein